MLQNFHQKMVNLNKFTNINENEIENICFSIKNDSCG